MSDDGLLAEYRRTVPSKAIPIVLAIVGLGLTSSRSPAAWWRSPVGSSGA